MAASTFIRTRRPEATACCWLLVLVAFSACRSVTGQNATPRETDRDSARWGLTGGSSTSPRAFWSDGVGAPAPTGQARGGSAGASVHPELNYMLDIYKQRRHQVRDSPDIEDHRKDEGRCQRPESTVIHSFPFIGVHNNCLHFTVTTANPANELCKGNLRLYYHSTGSQRRIGGRRPWWRFSLLVRLDIMALYPNANKTVVVASQTHPIPGVESSGWFDVEISRAFASPSAAATLNSQMFLEPRITLFGSGGKINIATDPGQSNHPLLVVYNHEDPAAADAALLEALARVRQRQRQELVERHTVPVPRDIIADNIVAARRKRSSGGGGGDGGAFVQRCQLHYMRVPMGTIGFQNVIQPRYFPMTYCQGTCQHPIHHPTQSSLHGRLMAMLHSMGGRRRRRAREPCCAPSGLLAGLDMLYVWPNGGFTIKYHSNMLVESCACN